MDVPGTRPLAGIFVVGASVEKAELCARLLADLGAEVVRLEPPAGAASRRLPPFAPSSGANLLFALRNAGKRGATGCSPARTYWSSHTRRPIRRSPSSSPRGCSPRTRA